MSSYLPITLGVSSSGKEDAQPLSGEERQAILARDDHCCRFCGFRSEKYQEVRHLDGKTANKTADNLATSCIFCNQCFQLDQVGAMRSGVLVWLPEMPQATLSHVMRAIYVGRISQGPMADAARKGLDILMARREDVRDRLGTDDPMLLASVLSDYVSPRAYSLRDKKLEGVRLLPLDRRTIKEADLEFNQFPQILAYWRSKAGPFGGKVPGKWLDVYREYAMPEAA